MGIKSYKSKKLEILFPVYNYETQCHSKSFIMSPTQ